MNSNPLPYNPAAKESTQLIVQRKKRKKNRHSYVRKNLDDRKTDTKTEVVEMDLYGNCKLILVFGCFTFASLILIALKWSLKPETCSNFKIGVDCKWGIWISECMYYGYCLIILPFLLC